MGFDLFELSPYLREKCIEKMNPSIYNNLLRTNSYLLDHISRRKHRYYGPKDDDKLSLSIEFCKKRESIRYDLYRDSSPVALKFNPSILGRFLDGVVLHRLSVHTPDIAFYDNETQKALQKARALIIRTEFPNELFDSFRPNYKTQVKMRDEIEYENILKIEYIGHYLNFFDGSKDATIDERIIRTISKFEVFGIYLELHNRHLIPMIFKNWFSNNLGRNNRIAVSIVSLYRFETIRAVLDNVDYPLKNIGKYYVRDYNDRSQLGDKLMTLYLLEREKPSATVLVGWNEDKKDEWHYQTCLIFYQLPNIDTLSFLLERRFSATREEIEAVESFAVNYCSFGSVPKWTHSDVKEFWV